LAATLEADSPAEDAAQAQDQKGRDQPEEYEVDRKAAGEVHERGPLGATILAATPFLPGQT
jgi:hypothetical protein